MITLHATERYLERIDGDSADDAAHLALVIRDALGHDMMRCKTIRAAVAATRGAGEHQIVVRHRRFGRVVVKNGSIVTVMR